MRLPDDPPWLHGDPTPAQRYHAATADLPLLAAESRQRQDRQQAKIRASVDRLLESVFGDEDDGDG